MDLILWFLAEYTIEIGSIAGILTVVEIIFAPIRSIRKRFAAPEKVQIVHQDTFAPIQTPPPPLEVQVEQKLPSEPSVSMSLDQYEQRLKSKIAEAQAALTTTHGAELETLQTQITELERRAQNPDAALAEARETIAKLETALEREGNDIGDTHMSDAKTALKSGDFSLAKDIFEEIQARDQIAVDRSARAAFALGEIAEQEIRWHDAARHYQRAASLEPTSAHLGKASNLTMNAGDYTKALALAEEYAKLIGSEFGEDSARFATALNNLARRHQSLGDFNKAELLLQQAIEIGKATIGENHPNQAKRLSNLAGLYREMDRLNDAERLFRQAIEIDKATIGEKHPSYAIRLNNLAALYRTMGRFSEAEKLYFKAIEIDKATIGENHPEYATRLNNLALLYCGMGRLSDAEPLSQQATKITKSTLGENHPSYAIRLSNLAGIYRSMSRLIDAEPLYLQALKIGKETIGENHHRYSIRLNNLAGLYREMGRLSDAEPLYLQAIDISKSTLGPDHPQTKQQIANYELLKLKLKP